MSMSLDGVLNGGTEMLRGALLTLGLDLIGVKLQNAEVVVVDLIVLLGRELSDHVINGLLRFDERSS